MILSKEIQQNYLIKHFEKHALEGNCQLRLYADIKLLDKTSIIKIPDRFIREPMQGYKMEYRKAVYKANLRFIPAKHRIRFIIGDIFPSVIWMKERHKCNGLRVFLYYPFRVGKLFWLI